MTELHNGDCLEVMKLIPDNSVDSIVTDPPYELGFMGKSWDSTGIANSIELWRQCLRVLKPGGYLLSFSATRTYHRMASAIEDAGFEIRDMIEWVYGSGFPKSLNIGKAVDKLQGNERIKTGEIKHHAQKGVAVAEERGAIGGGAFGQAKDEEITKGTSEWEGWGTALKPAHEPICMARKPISEKTVAENCLKWGTGGINIDKSRVVYQSEQDKPSSDWYSKKGGVLKKEKQDGFIPVMKQGQQWSDNPIGRFPANLILEDCEEVRECFPDTKSGSITKDIVQNNAIKFNASASGVSTARHQGDSGNASRFFKSIIYQPKASKAERNKGCEGLEEKQSFGGGGGIGDYLDDVNSASGKFGSEKAPAKNNHPTVKPVKLMEYLIEMVTPENGTVLEPFMGSGTTGIAAVNLNRKFIGIELDEHYFAICEKRIADAKKQEIQQTLFI